MSCAICEKEFQGRAYGLEQTDIAIPWKDHVICTQCARGIDEELIVAAAVEHMGGYYLADRHVYAIRKAVKDNPGTRVCGPAQGFMTNKSNYLTRKEAAALAFSNKQIKDQTPPDIIFSEDLW